MKIGNSEYLFAFTVGVACEKEERGIARMEQTRGIIEMALLMNKAYEDRQKMNNPNYVINYLKREELMLQNAEILPALNSELMKVYERDGNITVKTAPIKKKDTRADKE